MARNCDAQDTLQGIGLDDVNDAALLSLLSRSTEARLPQNPVTTTS
jgi:hypothetical protein